MEMEKSKMQVQDRWYVCCAGTGRVTLVQHEDSAHAIVKVWKEWYPSEGPHYATRLAVLDVPVHNRLT